MSAAPKPEKEEIKVFISHRDSTCGECEESLGRKAWITLAGEKGALCLACADLDHLVFLPSGDAALTRRARKHSLLSAVVLKWSRSRKRYERQGLLVEERALEMAEDECLADADVRARRREREAERRAELDETFVDRFAARIREAFPRLVTGREQKIAEHACLKYSGRIGRSALGKNLDNETNYDELLGSGWERSEARRAVAAAVDEILNQWQAPEV